MARLATTQRPPIVASLCLAAFAVLLGPHPVEPVGLEPMGPTPKCVVQGVRHGELYYPDNIWTSQMPTVVPLGHWTMPILPPLAPPLTDDIIDVDTLVSGLKRLLVTPHM